MRVHRENEDHRAWRKAHYNAAGINDKLILNLRDMSHIMRSLYEGRGSQKRILIILEEIDGSITQRELTERLGIQPGSASEVIAKLESAGAVRRTPGKTDRRTVDIELTDEGKLLASEAREQRTGRHVEMFSCLTDDEKSKLLSLLEKVNEDWEKRYRDVGENRGHSGHHHGEYGHHGKMHR